MRINIMIKLIDGKKEHKQHYFVVDKSNEFSTCSHCGLVRERKIIGWSTREDI